MESYGGLGTFFAKTHASRGGNLILVGRSQTKLDGQASEAATRHGVTAHTISRRSLQDRERPKGLRHLQGEGLAGRRPHQQRRLRRPGQRRMPSPSRMPTSPLPSSATTTPCGPTSSLSWHAALRSSTWTTPPPPARAVPRPTPLSTDGCGGRRRGGAAWRVFPHPAPRDRRRANHL